MVLCEIARTATKSIFDKHLFLFLTIFQKHKLKNLLNENFDENLSERDNMINNGYRIYYDTGNLVYHKKY